MTPDKFIELAYRTAPAEYPHFDSKILDKEIFHAWLGVTTECGESGDVVKKALMYGKEPDLVNLDEEFADKLWYVALYCRARGLTFEYLFDLVIAKLEERFPDRFTEEDAINRNVVEERRVLEKQAAIEAAQIPMTRIFVRQAGRRPTVNDGFYNPDTSQTFVWQVTDGVGSWVLKEQE